MKKILYILLISILVFSQMPIVFAVSPPKIYIESADYRFSRTDNVLVPIKMDSLPTTWTDGSKISYGSGIIFITYDKDKLEYVGTKSGTMTSEKGTNVTWTSVKQTGEVHIGFVDNNTAYGEGSFVLNSKDCILYLEFSVKERTIGDKIPVNLTRAEFGAIGDTNGEKSLISSSNTLEMAGGFVYIADYNYVNSFALEVYTDKNGTAVTEKYPVIVDTSASNKFYVVANPNKDGIVKAKIIPDFRETGLSLVITCADTRVKIDGTSIEIPADLTIKQADLVIKVMRADGSVDNSGEYVLTIVRGIVKTEVVKENITTVVDANDLAGAIDTKTDALAGVSTEIKLVVKQNEASTNDVTQIKIEAGDGATVFYFDVSLLVTKINKENEKIVEDQKVEKTVNPVTVKIEIPSGMLNGTNYKVLRVHNGVTEELEATREGNYLIFTTDKFSQYAISYIPTVSSGGGGGGSYSAATPSPSPTAMPANNHISYIKGYPDNTFKSENGITRAETVAIISRLSEGFSEQQTFANKFKDVEVNKWYSNYIGFIQDKNIVMGYPEGDFKPNGNITRAEFATIIARFKALNTDKTNALPFNDTSEHWATKYISAIYEKAYISGYPDSSFRPNANITRAEAVKIINAAIGRTPNKEKVNTNISKYQIPFNDVANTHWAYYEVLEATITHEVGDF